MARDTGGGMGGIIKYLLLAGGGFLLYKKLSEPGGLLAAAAPAAPAAHTPPAPAATAPAGTVGSLSLADLVAALRAAPPASTSGGAGSTPPVTPASNTLAAQLRAVTVSEPALVGGKLNADQWAWYYVNRLTGKQEIPSDIFHELFFPDGRPAEVVKYTLYSPEEFAASLATKGLSGLGARRLFRVPVVLPAAAADRARMALAVRRAAGSNYVRQASPMPVERFRNYVRARR